MKRPRRGDIYQGQIAGRDQTVVVVSSDRRNENFPNVLVSIVLQQVGGSLASLPTVVRLDDVEPVEGTVLLDYLWTVAIQELEAVEYKGRVSKAAMEQIALAALKVFEPTI